MGRRLFQDLVVSGARSGRSGRYAFPVSAVFHAAVVCAAVVVPALTPGTLPENVVHGAPVTDVFLPPPPPPQGSPVHTQIRRLPRPALRQESRMVPPITEPATAPETEDLGPVVPDEVGDGPGCGGCVPWGDPEFGVPGGELGGTPGAPPPREPLRIDRDMRPPRKIHHVNPVYPEIARRARVQGTVVLDCIIAPDGTVANVRLVQGVPLLDAAAMGAVRQWRRATRRSRRPPGRPCVTPPR